MTPDKTPSDAELQSAYDSVPAHGNQQDVHIAGLRAVLAKWGSPVVAGDKLDLANAAFTRSHEKYKLITSRAAFQEGALFGYEFAATPQPTQAQAGAVDDTALIQQMLDAAITIYPHLNGLAVSSDEALALLQQQIAAIAAARARLKETP